MEHLLTLNKENIQQENFQIEIQDVGLNKLLLEQIMKGNKYWVFLCFGSIYLVHVPC